MILKKLREFLDSRAVRYTVMSHSQAFTAQEISSVAHIPGKELAKTVMVKVDGKMTMAVVPASEMVDLKLLKHETGAARVELAHEPEFKDVFPDCEIGAMPPMGNLYGVDVLVAESLAEDEEIAFNAGTHRDLVRMAYRDFAELVRPGVMKLSVKKRSVEDGSWKLEA